MIIVRRRNVNGACPLSWMGGDRFGPCTCAYLSWLPRCSAGSEDNNWRVGRPVACLLGRSQPFPLASVRMSLLFSNPSHLRHHCKSVVFSPFTIAFHLAPKPDGLKKKNSLHYYWGEGRMPERVSIVDSDNSDTANNWIFPPNTLLYSSAAGVSEM